MTFLPKRQTHGSHSPGPSRFAKSRGTARGKALDQRVPHKPHASVQRMPKPVRHQHLGPQQPALRERDNDLRAAYSKSSMKLKRWFREGELLWCYLDPPIHGDEGLCISFWPGLVEEVKLKSEAIPRVVVDLTTESGTNSNGKQEAEHADDDDDDDDGGSPTPWTIRQSTVYKMKLLAVSYSYSVSDEKVLPYQAYVLPNELILFMQECAWGSLDTFPETMSKFNPCPPMSLDQHTTSGSESGTHGNGAMFADAVAPFALAIQIAAKLAGYWCLTDEWSFKFFVPPSSTTLTARADPTSASQFGGAIGLPLNTAAHASSAPSGPSVYQDVSGPTNDISEADMQSLRIRMLGVPAPPAQITTQIRYQGFWWGAERIWIDELVRLKMARRQLAAQGAPDIYPPAGPSQATLEYNKSLLSAGSLAEDDLGAGGKTLFLKLEGLFVVDTPREDGQGTRKECRASGMLYELVDQDWVDPHAKEHERLALAQEKQRLAESLAMTTTTSSTDPAVSTHRTPNGAPPRLISASPYPLPAPPKGFKFRPILKPGHEAVFSLSLIGGRYYPGILGHPLLQSVLLQKFANPLEEGGLHQGNYLWALEGLAPGYYNAVDPTRAKPNRITMMRDADKEARMEMQEACATASASEVKVEGEYADTTMHDGEAEPNSESEQDIGMAMDVDMMNL
jgi:hypothetical protein